jgi:transcriptional antiterminator NusG
MSLRWYVVHAYSNFEHKVSQSLKERVKRAGLEAKFGEILVPTEEVVEMRDGQKRKSDRKFFPGYVLVQMEMDEDTWHLFKEVPKVLGFIGGTSDKPAAITDKEAMSILRRVEEGVDKPKPKVLFEPGEVVRVTDTVSTRSSASGTNKWRGTTCMARMTRGFRIPFAITSS